VIFTDTHSHFHFPDFDNDREEVYIRAREGGIGLFINVGTDLETSRKAIAFAESKSDVFATVGVHPHDVKDLTDGALTELEALVDHPKVVAIGEVGLDFFRNLSPREVQIERLKTFFKWHQRFQKPLIIHCRDAYEEFLGVCEEVARAPYQGVMHCYSSNREMMIRLLDLGFHISFAGPLTYKKNDELREACQACPKDRLLLETDCPFLPPQSKRGKRNEPLYMIETAERAAKLHSVSLETLGEQTTSNARRLFGL